VARLRPDFDHGDRKWLERDGFGVAALAGGSPSWNSGSALSEPPSPATLPDLLRRARESLGWTLVDLRDETGIPLRSLSRWENGGARPNIQSAAQLYVAFQKLVPELAVAIARAARVPEEVIQKAQRATPQPAAAPRATPQPPAPPDAFELATFLAADDADIPASRLRRAIARLVPLWVAAGLTLQDIQKRVGAMSNRRS
jgi:transcriptional regulator with XRE-family HTH domain